MVLRKYVRKFATAVKRKLRKRYLPKTRSGRVNYAKGAVNLYRDVRMLKSMVNAEKKRFNIQSLDNTNVIGQTFGATGSGHIFADITPVPATGTGVSQRTGSSIKLHSMMAKFQLQQQPNATSPISGKVYIIGVKGSPVVPGNINEFLVYNKWLNAQNPGAIIYDTHCDRNQDYFKDFTVLASRRFYVKNDQLSAQTMIRDVNIPLKLNRHVKFNVDTTDVANGQLMMLWVCDSGNCGTTATVLSGVPQVSISTGLILRYDIQYYYYDN